MPEERNLAWLTEAEAWFLDAAMARLIPADDLGPGAEEADVTGYVDRRLAGAWGVDGRVYRSGPWAEGSPRQGRQWRAPPREVYRSAIREIDAWCRERFGEPFGFLDAGRRDAVLGELEAGGIDLELLPSAAFFELLWRNTREGFFSDPSHGGNRDMIGWRLIGFPGVSASSYGSGSIPRDRPYRVEPVSIADVRGGRVRVDAEGHPVHRPLAGGPVADIGSGER